jgi:hypothetical protein
VTKPEYLPDHDAKKIVKTHFPINVDGRMRADLRGLSQPTYSYALINCDLRTGDVIYAGYPDRPNFYVLDSYPDGARVTHPSYGEQLWTYDEIRGVGGQRMWVKGHPAQGVPLDVLQGWGEERLKQAIASLFNQLGVAYVLPQLIEGKSKAQLASFLDAHINRL